MLNSTRTGRTNYEEVFQAIGQFIDQNNFKEVVLVELQEGFLLRGLQFAADRGGFQTIGQSYLFTDEDIERLVEEAYQRRKAAQAAQAAQQQVHPNVPGGPQQR